MKMEEKVGETECEIQMSLECGTSLAASEWDTNNNNNIESFSEDVDSNGHEEKKDHHYDFHMTDGVNTTNNGTDTQSLLGQLRSLLANDIVGVNTSFGNDDKYDISKGKEIYPTTFSSPFEVKPLSQKYVELPLVYCDQTASNRPLASVERYIQDVCLPLYGNTHTNTSVTGSQSTAFVAEARQIVAESVNAKITGKAALDVVMFAGSGTTSAVQLLLDCLGISKNINNNTDAANRPVVFVGPYEHHSNLLPWRESGAEIVTIPENPITQTIDFEKMEEILKSENYGYILGDTNENQKATRLRMGTFTAASNVTGKVTDTQRIASLLHQYSALAFFDYATGAPYIKIDMNPLPTNTTDSNNLISNSTSDAIFISPHKMIGGINTPGILVIKKHLVSQNKVPSRSGGGTVFYVTHSHHRFLSNRIERYEGGTPNVIGIIRAGLSFLVKRKIEQQYDKIISANTDNKQNKTLISSSNILQKNLIHFEFQTHQYVLERLRQTAPNIIMLGFGKSKHSNPQLKEESQHHHLPIFSFLIKCGHRFLHYNYVCALLNDLFGIQARGGCQCSGPYSQSLLGLTTWNDDGQEIPSKVNQQIEHALLHFKERAELLRPGYTRLSLPFKGLKDEEVEYVIKALEWIAQNGWAMMCLYRCNHRTGEWRHFTRQGKPLGTERRWLSHFNIPHVSQKKYIQPHNKHGNNDELSKLLESALANADAQLYIARNDKKYVSQAIKMTDENGILGSNSSGDDEELDNLRWYVYPRESAKMLQDGVLIVPGTNDNIVLGSIRPRGYFDPIEVIDSSQKPKPIPQPTDHQSVDFSKEINSVVAPSLDSTNQTMDSLIPNSSKSNNSNNCLFFRDGEHHAGEATLEELQNGYDEGELSELAEIYEVETNGWVQIESFLKRDMSKHLGTTKTGVIGKDEPKLSMQSKEVTVQQDISFTKLNESDRSQTEKKSSRDSASWGNTAQNNIPAQNLSQYYNFSNKNQNDYLLKNETKNSSIMPVKKKNVKGKIKPPTKMMRSITQAMLQWDMIKDGDRLLLGLSGGKDSLSLLHCLLEFQKKLPIKFEIEVCTIDPMTPSFDPSPLIPYVESLGLKYHYIRDDIVSRANTAGKDGKIVSSLCAFCARMKRGNLYTCARKNNCNKLVLAQHLDDCAESFLMSVFHNGFLRTMKAHYEINAGDLSVIRPMIYCRESLMTEFAKAAKLPVINENCPACFEEPKERARIKKLLSREETLYLNLYDNIRRSILPLFHDDATAIMRSYTEEALAKSRKVEKKKKLADERRRQKFMNEVEDSKPKTIIHQEINESNNILTQFSDDDLVKELARRRAEKFKSIGSYQQNQGDPDDPTGQVCTLDGKGGTIRCRELME